jgi:hypothetical protein
VRDGRRRPDPGEHDENGEGRHRGHQLLTPGDVKWGPAPPVLPAGAQVAVLDGDPFKPGFFTLRLKFPDGYKIPAHTHPTDENIVVVQGTFRAGMGDAFSEPGFHDFPVGSFVKMRGPDLRERAVRRELRQPERRSDEDQDVDALVARPR